MSQGILVMVMITNRRKKILMMANINENMDQFNTVDFLCKAKSHRVKKLSLFWTSELCYHVQNSSPPAQLAAK